MLPMFDLYAAFDSQPIIALVTADQGGYSLTLSYRMRIVVVNFVVRPKS